MHELDLSMWIGVTRIIYMIDYPHYRRYQWIDNWKGCNRFQFSCHEYNYDNIYRYTLLDVGFSEISRIVSLSIRMITGFDAEGMYSSSNNCCCHIVSLAAFDKIIYFTSIFESVIIDYLRMYES